MLLDINPCLVCGSLKGWIKHRHSLVWCFCGAGAKSSGVQLAWDHKMCESLFWSLNHSVTPSASSAARNHQGRRLSLEGKGDHPEPVCIDFSGKKLYDSKTDLPLPRTDAVRVQLYRMANSPNAVHTIIDVISLLCWNTSSFPSANMKQGQSIG